MQIQLQDNKIKLAHLLITLHFLLGPTSTTIVLNLIIVLVIA